MFLDLVGKCIKEANLVFWMNTRYLRLNDNKFVCLLFWWSCFIAASQSNVILKKGAHIHRLAIKNFCHFILHALSFIFLHHLVMFDRKHATTIVKLDKHTNAVWLSQNEEERFGCVLRCEKSDTERKILLQPHSVLERLTNMLNRWPSAFCLSACRSCGNQEEIA